MRIDQVFQDFGDEGKVSDRSIAAQDGSREDFFNSGAMTTCLKEKIKVPEDREVKYFSKVARSSTLRSVKGTCTLGVSKISYGATDTLLNDRYLFPSFFRTVPNDYTTCLTISKFLIYFLWTWVGILASDNDTGEKETSLLKNLLTSHNICVAFVLKSEIQSFTDSNHMSKSMEVIKKSSAQIIIICGTFSTHMHSFLHILKDVLHDRILIINPTIFPHIVSVEDYHQIFNLSFLFDLDPEKKPNMESYFKSFHPLKNPKDMILENLWIIMFSCSSGKTGKDLWFAYSFNVSLHKCKGTERLDDFFIFLSPANSFQVYLAVQSLGDALHYMYVSQGHQSIDHQIDLRTHKVHIYIKAMMCSTKSGDDRKCFNDKGDKESSYVIYNDILIKEENAALRKVGLYSTNSADDLELQIVKKDIVWKNDKKETTEYLSYTGDILSLLLSCLSAFFSVLTIFILAIFILNRDTPIVRANNKNLSFVLLVSIMLSFFCVFLFLGHPVDTTCVLCQISAGILLSISISSLLAKTVMVLIVFKATKPGSVWRTWTGVKLPNCVLLICSSVQFVICMSWVTLSPPFQEQDTWSYKKKIVIQCNEGSDLWFYSVLGYMGILAAISFSIAFLARTLPDSFNEAKYITFSMLVFCSVWIAMVPAYISTKGKYMVALEIFAIIMSNTGLLGCIFLPKCYIILCRPELNTRKHVMDR
ncbi:vomeronasal type-2 receptor 26-like [Leptodactylus fuscus]